jgi:hypothetical protein
MIESKNKIKNLSATCIAWLAGQLGKFDLAFEFLDKAYEERDSLLVFFHVYTELYSFTISSDPRFKAVLARMKLADLMT